MGECVRWWEHRKDVILRVNRAYLPGCHSESAWFGSGSDINTNIVKLTGMTRIRPRCPSRASDDHMHFADSDEISEDFAP